MSENVSSLPDLTFDGLVEWANSLPDDFSCTIFQLSTGCPIAMYGTQLIGRPISVGTSTWGPIVEIGELPFTRDKPLEADMIVFQKDFDGNVRRQKDGWTVTKTAIMASIRLAQKVRAHSDATGNKPQG